MDYFFKKSNNSHSELLRVRVFLIGIPIKNHMHLNCANAYVRVLSWNTKIKSCVIITHTHPFTGQEVLDIIANAWSTYCPVKTLKNIVFSSILLLSPKISLNVQTATSMINFAYFLKFQFFIFDIKRS